jgi:LysR family transcriptional regulator, regulator for bpeEF and oprC
MDQLACMRVFIRVVEQGSFARAADDLDIAPPTATTAVAQLEKRLGARLLNRTTRRLSLTDEGRAFYEGSVRLLNELAEMEDALSSRRLTARGRMRASLPNAFIQREFFTALPRFLARHPQLSLELVLTDQTMNLVEGGIDCAVRAMDIADDSTLIVRRIAPVYRLTCASPAYLKAYGVPRSIEELERHNCIRFISPSTGRAAEWRFENGEERRSYAPRGSLGVTALESAVAAATTGAGIAQASHVLVMPLLRAGALQPLLLEWTAPGPPLSVVYPSSRYLTAKVRAFSEFIVEVFPKAYIHAKGEQGWWTEVTSMAAAQRKPRTRGPRRR